MSNSNVIKSISLSKRINNSGANFKIAFNTPLAPDEFVVGMPFEFILTDGTQPDEFTVFSGIIETITRDETNNNRIYEVSGRDAGRLLTRQPFKLDCQETETRTYTYSDILNLIIADTTLELGRGVMAITGEI